MVPELEALSFSRQDIKTPVKFRVELCSQTDANRASRMYGILDTMSRAVWDQDSRTHFVRFFLRVGDGSKSWATTG